MKVIPFPPSDREYQQSYPVAGDVAHQGLWGFELIGVTHCWQSGFAYANKAMAARAGRKLLVQISQMIAEAQTISPRTVPAGIHAEVQEQQEAA